MAPAQVRPVRGPIPGYLSALPVCPACRQTGDRQACQRQRRSVLKNGLKVSKVGQIDIVIAIPVERPQTNGRAQRRLGGGS